MKETMKQEDYENMMAYIEEVKVFLDEAVPDSREKSLAKTKFEEFEMWLAKAV